MTSCCLLDDRSCARMHRTLYMAGGCLHEACTYFISRGVFYRKRFARISWINIMAAICAIRARSVHTMSEDIVQITGYVNSY